MEPKTHRRVLPNPFLPHPISDSSDPMTRSYKSTAVSTRTTSYCCSGLRVPERAPLPWSFQLGIRRPILNKNASLHIFRDKPIIGGSARDRGTDDRHTGQNPRPHGRNGAGFDCPEARKEGTLWVWDNVETVSAMDATEQERFAQFIQRANNGGLKILLTARDEQKMPARRRDTPCRDARAPPLGSCRIRKANPRPQEDKKVLSGSLDIPDRLCSGKSIDPSGGDFLVPLHHKEANRGVYCKLCAGSEAWRCPTWRRSRIGPGTIPDGLPQLWL